MPARIGVLPLVGLDAVVLDTETTGLDQANARIVEIGAVRLVGGRLEEKSPFRVLVNPGEPIPASATRIHTIDDAAVAQAQNFAQAWPQASASIGDGIWIGHTLGFDLAVLKRECERAGLAWRRPRSLDTRLLAQIAEPNLGGYTLDALAAWLGVEMNGRHSAVGDAIATGRIFLALLPKLRAGGIRTLAEAEQACLALTQVLDDQHRAGWAEAVAAPRQNAEPSFARIDTYPYRHRVADVMNAPLKFVTADVPLGEALKHMAQERISSLLVIAAGAVTVSSPRETGIVTERDVLRAFAKHGADALALPVGQLASRPLAAVPAKAFIYRALARMSRLKLRHLGVVDDNGQICGIITSRDLLRLRAQEAVMLGDVLDQANDVAGLAVGWARLPQAVSGLLAEDVPGHSIAAVISRELGALTANAAIHAERRLKADGDGDPPCAYALCVLGSGGRGESLLAMDQDNAIVFAQGAPDGEADRWFAKLGAIVADILHEAGVPYCPGGVMARNPQWRGSLETWRERVAGWIGRSNPEDLLSVDIFFDLAGVHGDLAMANELWRGAFDAAKGNAVFAKLLVEAAGESGSGLNLFGGIRTEQGRIDLKMAGLFGIVTTARALAIRHHVVERSTPARLSGLIALGHGGEQDLEALAQAQGVFLDFILGQQLVDIERGLPPSNKVAVKRLTRAERERLRTALAAVRHLDALTRDLLF